ncbi:FMN-binding split barrel [Niveomyces insectorum RCEF 264]|uniref:FMN-binding split barrel n=1 Tax=Niveomyces insectorum RCEF 264 TaxID=1081102 RepID=A0A167ZCY8_9HYPO|nr:FMN-binding split barrel [Niveomyces insectorum RCEF 264]
MPRYDLEYPQAPHSTVRRYKERASYALRTIHGLVNEAQLLHVAFPAQDTPFPAVLPMIGQMGAFGRPSADTGDVLDLYLHGYVSARMSNLARAATGNADNTTAAAQDASTNPPAGLPVTVSATHVDGLVLARTPHAHSYNYRAAVLFGYATVVPPGPEKLYALQLITDGVVPGRWAHTRVPPTGAELQSTAVLKVRITAGSAKMRAGPPHDAPADLADPAVAADVWAGVVPVHTTLGTPIPDADNRVEPVPAYLEDFRVAYNDAGKVAAIAAAEEPPAAPNAKDDD